MLILNLKTYKETTGTNLPAVLASINDVIRDNPKLREILYIAPQQLDLALAKANYPHLSFIAQHVDALESGKTNGWVTVDNLVNLGLGMSMFNHSEHKISPENILSGIEFIQAKNLKLIVCCENIAEAEIILSARPHALAFEPPELIASGKSVSTQKPELVQEFIAMTKGKTIPIIGAGITNGKDIEVGLDLGAEGFLVSSAFVKAEDHYAKLLELIKPFNY